MNLYQSENVTADLERIKEDVASYYVKRKAEGVIQSFKVEAGHDNLNRFWATCEYLPTKDGERFGPITAHFTILIRDGKLEYQNGF